MGKVVELTVAQQGALDAQDGETGGVAARELLVLATDVVGGRRGAIAALVWLARHRGGHGGCGQEAEDVGWMHLDLEFGSLLMG